MKHKLGKLCLGLALSSVLSAAPASASSVLMLGEVIDRAGRVAEASFADPVRVFELGASLPGVCIPSAAQKEIQGFAALALRQSAGIAAARTYFSIQDQESRLLAAGERVADSYLGWQRLLRQANTLSASVIAEAEAGYFDALARREEIRVQLRQAHFLLASQIGVSEAQVAELQPLEDASAWQLEPLPVPPQGLRTKALMALQQWWQQRTKSASGMKCRQYLDSMVVQENREAASWGDIGKLRLQTLVKYELPAAEARLRLAEIDLDQARANVPGAAKLGVAMTNSLLALNRLQSTRHAIYLEKLQLERGIRATGLP